MTDYSNKPASERYALITFLTDFGLDWGPVGICHAVMRTIAPEAHIVDISHGIPPFDIRAGAWVMASAVSYAPVSVHLGVVDPGVGTERLPIAIRSARGDVLVGPDNGLLMPAAEKLGGVVEAREIANPDVMLSPVSHTFHGRDIFSPAAAHLASGVPLENVGPKIVVDRLVPVPWQSPEYTERHVRGEVALLDNFGNVRTNLEASRWPVHAGERLKVRKEGEDAWRKTRAANTFGEVSRGEGFIYQDSSGYLCAAVNLARAADWLKASPGDSIEIARDSRTES